MAIYFPNESNTLKPRASNKSTPIIDLLSGDTLKQNLYRVFDSYCTDMYRHLKDSISVPSYDVRCTFDLSSLILLKHLL